MYRIFSMENVYSSKCMSGSMNILLLAMDGRWYWKYGFGKVVVKDLKDRIL